MNHYLFVTACALCLENDWFYHAAIEATCFSLIVNVIYIKQDSDTLMVHPKLWAAFYFRQMMEMDFKLAHLLIYPKIKPMVAQ